MELGLHFFYIVACTVYREIDTPCYVAILSLVFFTVAISSLHAGVQAMELVTFLYASFVSKLAWYQAYHFSGG